MAYSFDVVEGPGVRDGLADLASVNKELVEGYLIVLVHIDGTMTIGHNACCASHLMAEAWRYVRGNPGMDVLNPALPHAHDL